MRKKIFQTILIKNFCEFVMFYQTLFSLQVKRIIIISKKAWFIPVASRVAKRLKT